MVKPRRDGVHLRGSIRLACDDHGPTPARPVALEIVDEDDLWFEGTGTWPECTASATGFFTFADAQGYPTPAEAIKAFFPDAIEPGDVLEQVGYPDAATPNISLVRDGTALRSFGLTTAPRGGWLVARNSSCS